MSDSQAPNPRKRAHSPVTPPLSPQSSVKRLKSKHTLHRVHWDSLSKVWLTKRALEELNRRNRLDPRIPSPLCQRQERNQSLNRSIDCEFKGNDLSSLLIYKNLSSLSEAEVKGLQHFARQGGPDLSDLRSHPEPNRSLDSGMSSTKVSSGSRKRSARSAAKSASSRNSSAYDRDFEQKLVDHGIHPAGYEYPDGRSVATPDNWDEIHQRLALSRSSLSPSKFSEDAFKDFQRRDSRAVKEEGVMAEVIPMIFGESNPDNTSASGILFTNLAHLTDGTLALGKPDRYCGARPEQLDMRIRRKLNKMIIPSTQTTLPMAPNFFLETKGPDGSLAVVGRQACYDGALGARAMHCLQSYGNTEPLYDNKAYTITTTYHGGTLKLFTTHPTESGATGYRSEYQTTQLRSFAMTDTSDSFRAGAGAFRNAKDWAKEKRDEFIEAANRKVQDVAIVASSSSLSENDTSNSASQYPAYESILSSDELALDEESTCNPSTKRPRRKP